MSRYRWIDARKAEGFPCRIACATAGVSTSAYYDWLPGRPARPTPSGTRRILVNEMLRDPRIALMTPTAGLG